MYVKEKGGKKSVDPDLVNITLRPIHFQKEKQEHRKTKRQA